MNMTMKTTLRGKALKSVQGSALVASLCFVGGQEVNAAGFQLMEQSVTGLGRSFAGGSLAADDASAAFYNPADMLLLEKGGHTQVGLVYIDVNAEVEGTHALGGSGKDNAGTDGLVPNFHLVTSINDDMSLGLAINAPFGLATEYDDDWFGRYDTIKSELKTVDINPSIAYKLNDQFYIGGGLSYQYVEAELTQAIPAGPFPDGKAKITGDDWSWGFNLGATWLASDDMKVSMTYRSKVDHELEGDREITGFVPPLDGNNGKVDGNADVELPETFTVNVHQRFNDKWAVMGSWRYTRWSRFEELRVEYDDPTEPDTVEEQNWDNSWAISFGATYEMSQAVTLRGGMSYDNSPVPNDEYRSPRIPDSDRYWFSAGASWHISDSMTLDGGYTYLLGGDEDISREGSSGLLEAEISDSYAHLLGVQFQYSF